MPPNKGVFGKYFHTEESKLKMRKPHKKFSNETIEKMKTAQKIKNLLVKKQKKK